ncbi:hypothetical protein [Sphingosinicella sp. BN140058]|uniref:hypothetical protein n=1 Tax=Sphingosinicella sp. BN140058 TaxID=1892855 RepID=UPI001011897E|nr:hypothetical protein [Sphingosinicella sp. BN140058]QAY75868.1 hypothetical protein ETR14_04480 [Sphingosinicella sp. BN140058]
MSNAEVSRAPATRPIIGLPIIGLLVAWILVCAFALWLRVDAIRGFWLIDADDHLRLVQVRDWMAGQSWFDVTQYRFEPPAGASMHWSRLVDLPLAAGIGLLTPLLGSVEAERVTLIMVPLLLLGLTMVFVFMIARRVMGGGGAVLAAALISIAPPVLLQLLPLRIDHHGWQLAMAALALLGLLLRDARVSGGVGGLAMATWMHVSIEALPLAVAAGAILGIRYIRAASERERLYAYLAALLAGSLLLFAATHLPTRWWAPYCDAVSPVYLLPLASATIIVLAGSRLPWLDRWPARALLLGGAAAIAGGVLLGVNPSCAASPFATLHPLVYRYWYLNVAEGLPIWRQPLSQAAMLLWLPLVGGFGTALALRNAGDDEGRRNWLTIGLLLAAAFLVSLSVFRAGGVSQLYALPGCAYFIIHFVRRAQRSTRPLVRVVVSAAVVLLPLPVMPAAAIKAFQPGTGAADKEWNECADARQLRPLASMPKARFLAPLNIGPALLHYTRHATIAGSYHRSNLAIRDMMVAFMSPPEQAEKIVRARGLDHVLICTTGAEAPMYGKDRRNSLIARLLRGQTPQWLEPVPLHAKGGVRVWRVRPVAVIALTRYPDQQRVQRVHSSRLDRRTTLRPERLYHRR